MKPVCLLILTSVSLAPAIAVAQSSISATVQGISVVVIGDSEQSILDTPTEAEVTLDGRQIGVSPTTITLNGQSYLVSDPAEIVIDGTGYGLIVSADGAIIAEISVFDGLTAAATAGDGAAQNNLALLYATGDRVPQDPVRALEPYTAAAKQGTSVSQSNVAFIYYDGVGVPADPAQQCLAQAAALGSADAAADLAALTATAPAVTYYDADGQSPVGPVSLAQLQAWRDGGRLTALLQTQ